MSIILGMVFFFLMLELPNLSAKDRDFWDSVNMYVAVFIGIAFVAVFMIKTLHEYDKPVMVVGKVIDQHMETKNQQTMHYITVRFIDEFDSTNQFTSWVPDHAYEAFTLSKEVRLQYTRRHPETAFIIPIDP